MQKPYRLSLLLLAVCAGLASQARAQDASAMKLPPPLTPAVSARPVALPPLPPGTRVVGAKEKATGPSAPTGSTETAATPTPSTRKALCSITLRMERYEVGAEGQELVVQFSRKQVNPCLTAASAEHDWVEAVLDATSDRVSLSVAANPTNEPRATNVYVATSAQSFVVRVSQAPAKPPRTTTPISPVTAASPEEEPVK